MGKLVDAKTALQSFEYRVLQYMDEMTPTDYGFWGFPLRCFTEENMTKDLVSAVLKNLTDKKYTTFMRGLMTEDGEVAGSGYGITDCGRKYLREMGYDG